jgi:hypothetical protein
MVCSAAKRKKLKDLQTVYITRRLNSIDEEDSEWKILDIKEIKKTDWKKSNDKYNL